MRFDDTLVGIERCQSPLERKLAEAFAEILRFEWRRPTDHRWEIGRGPGWFVALLAQPDYDRYRADFGICTGLDLYQWINLGDTSAFDARGCVGSYMRSGGGVPFGATCTTRLEFSVPNRARLDPFGE